jgi:hypothetical protein
VKIQYIVTRQSRVINFCILTRVFQYLTPIVLFHPREILKRLAKAFLGKY